METPRHPLQNRFLRGTIAALLSGAVCVSLVITAANNTKQEAPEPQHSVPEEVLCLVPSVRDTNFPAAMDSAKPVIRLRELTAGHYQLLYWGNPVRSKYMYSIKRVEDNKSILLNSGGKTEQWRVLPVTVPQRGDNKLPRQPIVELGRLQGKPGEYCAVRISIHDAATGTVLASVIYVIEGNTP